jgi:hypothetical protein
LQKLRKTVDDDIKVNMPIILTESELHTFVFEVARSEGEGDEGVQKIRKNYKVISVKNRLM